MVQFVYKKYIHCFNFIYKNIMSFILFINKFKLINLKNLFRRDNYICIKRMKKVER